MDSTDTYQRAKTGLTPLTWTAIALVVIGALNWGLVGAFGLDLVAALFGTLSWGSRIIYILVALAGIYLLAVSFGRLREGREPTDVRTTTTTP